MNWYESVLEPCANSIIQNILDPAKKSQNFSSWMDHEERDKIAKRDLFENVFKQLESMLEDQEFLVTDDTYTAIDIAYYSKIKTVQALTLCQIDEEKFENIAEWFQRMSEIDEIEDADEQLYEVIEKYELE